MSVEMRQNLLRTGNVFGEEGGEANGVKAVDADTSAADADAAAKAPVDASADCAKGSGGVDA